MSPNGILYQRIKCREIQYRTICRRIRTTHRGIYNSYPNLKKLNFGWENFPSESDVFLFRQIIDLVYLSSSCN